MQIRINPKEGNLQREHEKGKEHEKKKHFGKLDPYQGTEQKSVSLIRWLVFGCQQWHDNPAISVPLPGHRCVACWVLSWI